MYEPTSQDELTGFIAGVNAITNNKYEMDANYLLAYNASPVDYNLYKPELGAMAWWITNSDNTYSVYTFAGIDFITGIIEAAEQLGKDFRDYILGTPYSYDSKGQRINYSIEGYDVLPYTGLSRVSAPIGPFYTGSIEDDAQGADWES